MRTMSARDAKNSFGLLLDYARAEPVQVEKHGRPVVVVISVEEFERLTPAVPRVPFVNFMEALYLGGLDLEREADHGGDVEL